MPDDRESSSGAGVMIAAVAVVLVLLICGGGALVAAGMLFHVRSHQAVHISPPPPPAAVPVEAAHVDVLQIDDEGALLWNDGPITTPDLRERIDQLKLASGPPRSLVVRFHPQAPVLIRDEVVQLLNDRQVSFILEAAR